MVQFVSYYDPSKKTAECYIDITDKSSPKNFQLVFLKPSIIFGDKKAVFSLPNYTLDFRYGYDDTELSEIVDYIKENERLIYEKLEVGLKSFLITISNDKGELK